MCINVFFFQASFTSGVCEDYFQVGFNAQIQICVTIMCRHDELSSTMSWVGCLLKDSELFILFAENNQILLKISVFFILLTFIYLVGPNLLVDNQLNSSSSSSLRHIIVTQHALYIQFLLRPAKKESNIP